MKQYTIILRTPIYYQEAVDEDEAEFYVFNAKKRFETVQEAARFARIEAAKAQTPDYRYTLEERFGGRNSATLDPRDYEIVMAFEGHHKPTFGWQPELSDFR